METITLTVEDMTCGGCVKSVERALGHAAGVASAKASLEAKSVLIDFDPTQANRESLTQTIRRAGFTLK
ncbi:MAG: heavy-metal-associated domain-containing protein [Alphaproteobacteria bacterium]|nr:heavy-metal-associated domain-containing protein [Alphaproteobacteria bacterium]